MEKNEIEALAAEVVKLLTDKSITKKEARKVLRIVRESFKIIETE